MSLFAFINAGGIPVTPKKVIFSYSLLDLIMKQPFNALLEEQKELKAHAAQEKLDAQDHTLWGVVIFNEAKKARCFKKYLTLKAMRTQRPLHYRDNDSQEVHWASTQLADIKLDGEHYAVLCEPVTVLDNAVMCKDINETLQSMIAHHQVSDENPLPVSIGGARQTYNNVFGDNPLFMKKHCLLHRAMTPDRLTRAEDADQLFSDWRNQNYLEAAQAEILRRSKLDIHGWTTLTAADGETTKVPTLPLTVWALRKLSGQHLDDITYRAVSFPNMKQFGDDRFHTDWLIGGGLSLDYHASKKFEEAAHDWAHKAQIQTGKVEHHVLVSAPIKIGRAFHGTPENADQVRAGDILILPDGSQTYHLHAMKACKNGMGGVICEQGSQAAHLIKVGREMDYGVLRIPSARERFPHGTILKMHAAKGCVDFAYHPGAKV